MSLAKASLADDLVGREEELAHIAAFVGSMRTGPAALVIQGEAGIGKTTLWRQGIQLLEGAGFRVLKTTSSASETSLPLSVLSDLLEPVFPLVRTDLPAPQRRALDVALSLAEPEDPSTSDDRLLRVATRSALRALLQIGPVALAVDDCQWIDPASAAALTYALRRLETEPFLCLLSLRLTGESAFDVAQLGDVPVERLTVGPLSLGATQRLLLHELGVTYPRPVIRRLVETSGGNPFYALELSRRLERSGSPSPDVTPLLSESLDALIAARLDGVSDGTRRLLGLLSLLPSASIRLLHTLDVLDGLDEAVAAGLVEVDGDEVLFAHPLLAAGARARLGPGERRGYHAALASALDDPVERARQLARATLVASTETADELAHAASVASGRARPTIAAELAEDAARLTPDSDPRARLDRRMLAARFHAQAGAFERAGQLFDELIPELPAGDERADALRLRAKVASDISIQRDFLRRALAESDNPSITAKVNALLARNCRYFGDIPGSLAAARAADELAQETDDLRLIAGATTIRGLMEIWGTGAPDPGVYERARRLAATGAELRADTYSNPHTLLAVRALYRYEVDEARDPYEVAVSAAEAAGDVDSLETYWWGLAQLEVRAGRYREAGAYVERLRDSVEIHDRRPNNLRWIEGVLATYEGREEDARRALEETIATAEAGGNWFFVIDGRAALAFLELSLGNVQAAVEILEPVISAPFVVQGDPGQTGLLPIAAEALLATGALDLASDLIAHLEKRGRELTHPWCLATAGRCRGLLLAERRDFDAAFDAFEEALGFHARVPAPFERARTLLAQGVTERRARRRRAARESLEAAEATFDELGTPLWAERARSELSRVGGRTASPGDLTPNERRIAGLVAEGKTNKEVAAALFVSDRTVESALTQIYRKLDIRSRTELAHKLSGIA